MSSAENCQSSQTWYYGRGHNGDFWEPEWLMPPDGIVAEAKKMRLWTYEDDVEGRRNNTDEETEEAVPEKKEETDIKEA